MISLQSIEETTTVSRYQVSRYQPISADIWAEESIIRLLWKCDVGRITEINGVNGTNHSLMT